MDKSVALEKLADVYIENNQSPTFAFYSDLLIENGEIDKAILILEQLVKKYPEYELGHFILGKAYYQKGNYDDAKAELDRAVAYYPDLTNAYLLLLDIAKRRNSQHLVDSYQQKLKFIDPIFYHDFESQTKEPDTIDDDQSGFEEVDTLSDADKAHIVAEDTIPEEEINRIQDTESTIETTDEIINEAVGMMEQESDALEVETDIVQEMQEEQADKESSQEIDTLEADIDVSAIENDLIEDEIEEEISDLDIDVESSDDIDMDVVDDSKDEDAIDNIISDLDDMDVVETESFKSEGPEDKQTVDVDFSSDDIDFVMDDDDDSDIDVDKDDDIDIDMESEEETQEETQEDDLDIEANVDSAIDAIASPMIDDENLMDELKMVEKKETTADSSSQPTSQIASPTLGEIYLSQGNFVEAKKIFETLLQKEPDNEKLQRKLDDINKIIG